MLDVNETNKTDIVLSLHDQFRNHVNFWHDHVYKATTWSILPAYGLVTYYSEHPTLSTWWTILALVVLIWILSALYLWTCHRAHKGNWAQIVNCQHALKLEKKGVYFADHTFFDNKGATSPPTRMSAISRKTSNGLRPQAGRDTASEGMRADDIVWIRRAHSLAFVAAVVVMLLLRW
jgi:hypothetical protein